MFQLMDKKIITILPKLFLLNWPFDISSHNSESHAKMIAVLCLLFELSPMYTNVCSAFNIINFKSRDLSFFTMLLLLSAEFFCML